MPKPPPQTDQSDEVQIEQYIIAVERWRLEVARMAADPAIKSEHVRTLGAEASIRLASFSTYLRIHLTEVVARRQRAEAMVQESKP